MLKALSDEAYKLLVATSFLLSLLAASNALAQKKLPDVVLSIDARNVSLTELLNEITEKTGFAFSYNPKKIPVQSRITYQATNKNLEAVLSDVCGEFGLTFEFVENQIVVKPDKSSTRVADQTFTISGTIKDADSGEALIGASVFVRELSTGTITNAFGFYSLTIPQGQYNITFSFVGYGGLTEIIQLSEAIKRDLMLKQQAPVLEEVVVGSSASITSQILTSNTNVRPARVEERPEMFGEMDVIKSLESIPGVKFHSDGSTFYYVRGGFRDQNVVFIDDAPIYNPSHMLGVFSTIIPDAVNDITLYKGDMPASLGGRLSSVLDVRTKKGNDQHFSAWGNVGFISTKLGVEGPFKKSASSYLLSTRFSSLQWLMKRAVKEMQRFSFHDLTGKINVRFNENNRMFLSFYSGADNYFINNSGIAWSNNAATLQLNHLFNDRLFLNVTLAGGGYDYYLYSNVNADEKWNAHISNLNIKSDFSYFIRPENEMTFGLGINGYSFNPGNFQRGSSNIGPILSVKNSVELVLYGNHEVRINNKFGVNYGLRISSWSNVGEAFEFIFDENGTPGDTLFFQEREGYKHFVNAEPRLTLSYFASERASVKATFSRNVQNIHLISNSVSPFTSLDVWLPSSFNIKPQIANQVTIGYYHQHPLKSFAFSLEGFYKRMTNQIDFEPHAQTLLNPLFESELRFGRARSYGVEILLKKEEGRLRGWVGYAWSRAKRRFPDLNNGTEYNAFYDRPHQLNLTTSYDISRRWQLGANWTFSTGSAYSSPVSFYSYNDEEVPVYGQKNNARLPDYHRLDLSGTYRLNKDPENRFVHNLSFSVFNFYGRKNPVFMNFNKMETDDGSFVTPGDVSHGETVTSKFYLYGFMPSVSYNFKWL